MIIRGWVYVLSNRAMPNMLKIGFSTRDPSLRIQELNTTGLPHPFVVEYDVLVMGPREVEQAVHAELKKHHEAKEFFRVSVSAAIATIRSVITTQSKKIVAEQANAPSIVAEQANTPSHVSRPNGAYEKNQCPVCGTTALPTHMRCGKCFALLL